MNDDDNPFKSNLPEGFKTGQHFSPLKTEAEKEHYRKKTIEWFSDPDNHSWWKEKTLKALQESHNDPEWHADWYAKNNARFDNPEYIEKLSNAITQFYIDNPDFQQQKVNDPKWKKAHAEGVRRYIESPDYVHPRGMLGKTMSEESRNKIAEANFGKINDLEHNQKTSKARKGFKPKKESVEKMRKALIGRESGRSRKIQTPHGVFEKLKDAASFYGVTEGALKNWLNKTTKTVSKKDVREKLLAKGVILDENGFPQGFEWLGDMKSELGAKKVQTPDGTFENSKAAASYYQITPAGVRHRIKKWPEWKYVEENE